MLHFTREVALFSHNQICLIKLYKKYCEFFVSFFVALSVCIFHIKLCCFFPESFCCIQIKLELFSLEIVSILENIELLSHFRVSRKKCNKCTNWWTDNDGRTVIHWLVS